jgi:hypothetical protein
MPLSYRQSSADFLDTTVFTAYAAVRFRATFFRNLNGVNSATRCILSAYVASGCSLARSKYLAASLAMRFVHQRA